MRVQKFPIEGETVPRLELRWHGVTAHVYFDGAAVAELDGPSGLKRGWSTQLADGRTLEIRAIRRVLFRELSVLVNGEHVPSSPSHPDKMLRTCSNVLLIVSAFLILSGSVGVWDRNWADVAYGSFYLVGGLLLRSRRAIGAAVVAVPIVTDFCFFALTAVVSGIDTRWVVQLLLTLFFGTFVIRSYHAARDSQRLLEQFS